MKKMLVCIVSGVLFVSFIGCSPKGTTEAQPDPIEELDMENVPPVGE